MTHSIKTDVGALSSRVLGYGRRRLRRLVRPAWLGTLRSTSPLSESWGYDRGTPIDRSYIDRFLRPFRGDIRGRVLEVRDDRYTLLGGAAVTQNDIVDIDASNPRATLVADLAHAESIPSDRYDCFVCTQTYQYVLDLDAAIATSHRILKPGGVLLATVPGIAQLDRANADGDYWRFTPALVRAKFSAAFSSVHVEAFGNCLTAVGVMTGLAAEELSADERDLTDVRYPLVIGVRCIKR